MTDEALHDDVRTLIDAVRRLSEEVPLVYIPRVEADRIAQRIRRLILFVAIGTAISVLVIGGLGLYFRAADERASSARRADAAADRKALCEQGNDQSQLRLEEYIEQIARAETFDPSTLNLTPEQFEVLKRQSRDQITHRIERLPFVDCATGQRLPPRTPPG